MDGTVHTFRPQQTRPEDLEAILVAREPLLGQVLERLAKWQAGATRQHFLLIGPRGIGKTHLLCLIRHRILLDAKLSAKWQPILLPEETYRVTAIADLLIEVLKFMFAETQDASIQHALTEVEFNEDEARVVDLALDAFRRFHRTSHKGVVLMVENLDRLLERQIKRKSEIHLLRKILLEEEWLTLICSSPTYLNAVNDPDQPLFEFFAVKQLGDLTLEEQTEMLRKLSVLRGNDAFAKSLDQYQSRLRALYHFTGGNPRLTVLLYELVSNRNLGTVQSELTLLLDQITPFYQDRMKDVGEQAGKILEAMALAPDSCSPTELARRSRLEPAILRAQLARLEKAGYVRRGTRQKKQTIYQIPERLFRIWHQMNHSHADQGHVQYLLEFFADWYATKEERDLAWKELSDEFETALPNQDQEKADDITEILEYLVETSDSDEKSSRKLDLLIHKAKHYPDELLKAALSRRDASDVQAKPDVLREDEWESDTVIPHEVEAYRQVAIRIQDDKPWDLQNLLRRLHNSSPHVRAIAAEALGRIGSSDAVPQLLETLRDGERNVRASAATALGNIQSREAAPHLIKALRDEGKNVRASAATALGIIRSEDAVSELTEALRDEARNVRSSAAKALGNIGSRGAIPQLIEALRDEAVDVRASAAKALGNIGLQDAAPPLTDALRDEAVNVRASAATALGNIGSRDAVPQLIEALRDEAISVRANAATALGNIGSHEATPRLLETLKDYDLTVRGNAAMALGRISVETPFAEMDQTLEHLLGILGESHRESIGRIFHYVLRSAIEYGDLDKTSRILDLVLNRYKTETRYFRPHVLALEYLRSNRDPLILERQSPEMREAIELLVNAYDRKQAIAPPHKLRSASPDI